jgi:hypothetical protein
VASATGRSLQTSCATLGLLISTKRGGRTAWALAVAATRTGSAGGDGKADAGGDPLHAIYGMLWRTPLLRAFAAGQGQSTTARWAPLLSLAVPCFMPQTCPKDASGF